MRERYIQMRRTNQIDLNWFYEFYVQEFPNIPKTWFKGGQEYERELIPANQFFTPLQMMLQLHVASIFEYLDKKMDVVKIEDAQGNLISVN